MRNSVKIVIIILLITVAGGVIYLKNNKHEDIKRTDLIRQQPIETAQSLPRLLDLGAGKCIPCKMMAPILDELKEQYAGQFEVVFIDVWENPDEAQSYQIKLIPTQIFFDNEGKELFRHEGFYSKEDILNKWSELGIQFAVY